MQAVAELSVVYPVNGAFTMYICRFVDPSFGWACGIEYAISWLTVLPFEISAACNIIHYWPGAEGINNSAWIVPVLVALVVIQVFGVRGYGEASSSHSRTTRCGWSHEAGPMKLTDCETGRIRPQPDEGHCLPGFHHPGHHH